MAAGTAVPIETVKFTLITSSILSCLIAEVIWARFSVGGGAGAEVAALPVVLLSGAEGLISAVGVFKSFEVVPESSAFALLSAFVSPALLSGGDFVSAVGFVLSFEVAAGAVESEAFDLPSGFMSAVVRASGLPCGR